MPKLVAIALEAPFQYNEELGMVLYHLLDGDGRYLTQARDRARHAGEKLVLRLELDTALQDLPFELLYDGRFLLPSEIHLVRNVGDRGRDRQLVPADRPLKLLFMACSAIDVEPELDFEKEEDAIFRATEGLPIEIIVEDSGSLQGLAEKLKTEKFDLIHLSGHAGLDQSGAPFFLMENDEGGKHEVYPEELWRTLRLNPPTVLFLAGCQTGQADPNRATGSYAQQLVSEGIPAVLGWGRPVYDLGATEAAKQLYFELSRGNDLASAVLACRRTLSEAQHKAVNSVWPLLRLFADATPFTPLVTPNQKLKPTARKLTHTYLAGTQVKILTAGYVGRRRQIQDGLRVLRHGQDDPANPKVGVLLHGTTGLGKSCLAGKLIERLSDKDTTLVVVHGRLDAVTFDAALREAFVRAQNATGLTILDQKKEMAEKIHKLCVGPLQENRTLILCDDFEQNFVHDGKDGKTIPVFRDGHTILEPTAAAVLQALLRHIPTTAGMTSLIITSRYLFRLPENGVDLVLSRLAEIGLTSFRAAELRKKYDELPNLNTLYW
ncbi:MAG: CHAT domain-containing protein, partial [bacterium]